MRSVFVSPYYPVCHFLHSFPKLKVSLVMMLNSEATGYKDGSFPQQGVEDCNPPFRRGVVLLHFQVYIPTLVLPHC